MRGDGSLGSNLGIRGVAQRVGYETHVQRRPDSMVRGIESTETGSSSAVGMRYFGMGYLRMGYFGMFVIKS